MKIAAIVPHNAMADSLMDDISHFIRANHASNYLNLRGELNRDIPRIIRQIEYAEKIHSFRPEGLRGL